MTLLHTNIACYGGGYFYLHQERTVCECVFHKDVLMLAKILILLTTSNNFEMM